MYKKLFLLFLTLPLFGIDNGQRGAFSDPFAGQDGFIEGVNVVTGCYAEYFSGLKTQGLDPCSIEMSYTNELASNLILNPPNLLGWYANDDTKVLFENDVKNCHVKGDTLLFTQKTGHFAEYRRSHSDSPFVRHSLQGFTNTHYGQLTGQTHIHNCVGHVAGSNEIRQTFGDGAYRSFSLKHFTRGIKMATADWQRHPSGNMLYFTSHGRYTKSQDNRIYLNSMTAVQDSNMAWVITNNDQRRIICHPKKNPYRHHYVLDRLEMPDGSQIFYHYNDGRNGNDWIVGKDFPEGRFLHVEYQNLKVSTLKAPISSDSSAHAKYRFRYGSGFTELFDALGNKVSYYYDEQQRIVAIVHYKEGLVYRTQKNIWNGNGSLLATLLIDDKGVIQLARRFFYDERHNVTCEKVYGVLTGTNFTPIQIDHQGLPIDNGSDCYTKHYGYTNDGYNLLAFESDGIATTHYSYIPNTNLLHAKLISENGHIRLRTFRFYDEMSGLIAYVEDDGHSIDPHNLSGCTRRKVVRYENSRSSEGVGQPLIRQEWHTDMATHSDILDLCTSYSYDKHNQCIKETICDGLGNLLYTIERSFDAMGRCIFETTPLGDAIYKAYDANCNLIKETGLKGKATTEYSYDFSNRLIAVKKTGLEGAIQTHSYVYDVCGNKVMERDINGNATYFSYDALGREITTTFPQSYDVDDQPLIYSTSKIYDICDNVIEWIDENGSSKRAWYTLRGVPYRTVDANGEELFEYDLRGNLVKKIHDDGTTSLFTYDFIDRPTSSSKIGSNHSILEKTTLVYDAFGLLSLTDATGLTTTIHYDGLGRERLIQKANSTIEKSYDALGFVKSEKEWTDELHYIVKHYLRDPLGNILEERIEDEKGTCYSKKHQNYNAEGKCVQLIEFIDEMTTATTFFEYDAFGREIKRQEPGGATTQTTYQEWTADGLGGLCLLRTITDAKGTVIKAFFDARGQQLREIVSDASDTTLSHKEFRYNGTGHRIAFRQWQKEGKWQEIRMGYTASGKLAYLRELQMNRTTYYRYDSSDRLIYKETPLSTHIFSYDELGRVISHSAQEGSETIETRYQYDLGGRLTSLSQNGKETLRRYDALGNIIYEKQASGYELYCSYDQASRRTSLKLPHIKINYTYAGPFLQSVTMEKDHQKYCHRYNKRNFRGAVLEAEMINGTEATYYYDTQGRSIAIKSKEWHQEADYDPVSNLICLSTQNETSHFGYDGLKQLTQENEQSYQYDGMGNAADVGLQYSFKNRKNTT